MIDENNDEIEEIELDSEIWSDIFSDMIERGDDLNSVEENMIKNMQSRFGNEDACVFILNPLSEDESNHILNWLKEINEDEKDSCNDIYGENNRELWWGEEKMKSYFPYLFSAQFPYELYSDGRFVNFNVEFAAERKIVGYLHGNAIYEYAQDKYFYPGTCIRRPDRDEYNSYDNSENLVKMIEELSAIGATNIKRYPDHNAIYGEVDGLCYVWKIKE